MNASRSVSHVAAYLVRGGVVGVLQPPRYGALSARHSQLPVISPRTLFAHLPRGLLRRFINHYTVNAFDTGVGTLEALPAPRDQGWTERDVEQALPQLDSTLQRGLLLLLGNDQICKASREDNFPLPPAEQRENYFNKDDVLYWVSGLGDYLLVMQNLCSRGSVLDLGCGILRVGRHFLQSNDWSYQGADVGRGNVAWIRSNVRLANALQATFAPPLPLPSESVDLVIGLSVFTYIDEFEEAWINEINRLLSPKGAAFATVHSDRAWTALASPEFFLRRALDRARGSNMVDKLQSPVIPNGRCALRVAGQPYQAMQIFHSRDYVRERWGTVFGNIEFVECAYGEHQDGVRLRKS